MADQELIESMCFEWEEELRESGRDLPAQELCARHQCPHLAERLAKAIANARRPGWNPTAFSHHRFQLGDFHKGGGQGLVFRANDTEIGRDVAVKRLKRDFLHSAKEQRRFEWEAKITGELEHPGIVPIYSLTTDANGEPFYAMRFIEGASLQQAIDVLYGASQQPRRQNWASITEQEKLEQRDWNLKLRQALLDPKSKDDGPVKPEEQNLAFHKLIDARATSVAPPTADERQLGLRRLLNRLIAVCEAMAYAHSRGVIHRDLKPANVMLGSFGETLVVDWGLAKRIPRRAEDKTSGLESVSGSPDPEYTKGRGTPVFMSPEQAQGKALAPTSDVYSLGAALYVLLTGELPFPPGTYQEILDRVIQGRFPRPRQFNLKIPKPLEAICLKAMTLAPNDRYATAKDLAQDLERWLTDEPTAAWPEPVFVRSGRWVRKHQKSATAFAASVILGLVFAFTLWMTIEEHRQERRITKARAEAAARENARNKLNQARSLLQDSREKTKRISEKLILLAQAKLAAEGGDPSAGSIRSDIENEQAFFRDLQKELDDARGLSLNEPKRAITLFRKLLSKYEGDPEIHYHFGRSLYWISDYQEAIKSFEKTIALDRTHRLAYFNIALAWDTVGRPEQATPYSRKAVALDPGSLLAKNNLAHCLNGERNYVEAISIAFECVASDPKYWEAYANLAYSFNQMESFDITLDLLNFSLEEENIDDLTKSNLYNDLGWACSETQQFRKSKDYLKKAIALNPKESWFHNNLGWACIGLKEYPEAIHHLHESLRLNKNNQTARGNLQIVYKSLFELATLHFSQGRIDEIIDLLEALPPSVYAEIDDLSKSRMYYYFAKALGARERVKEAKRFVLKALLLKSNEHAYRSYLGIVHIRLSEYYEGIPLLEEVLRNHDDPDAQRYLDDAYIALFGFDSR